MTLEARIARGANAFYWIAGLSLVNVLLGRVLPGFSLPIFVEATALGIVNKGSEWLSDGLYVQAYGLSLFAIAAFFAIGKLAHRRSALAFFVGAYLYAVDGVFFFFYVANLHPGDTSLGLTASMGLVIHAVFFVPIWRAMWACRQYRWNASIAQSLDVEAALRRKLDESDTTPAPSAASFQYRYRQIPNPPVG